MRSVWGRTETPRSRCGTSSADGPGALPYSRTNADGAFPPGTGICDDHSMATDPRNGMEILSEEQCWGLLDEEVVGRLAVAPGGRPDIFPVNFIVHDGRILFRTAEGSKLTSIVVNHAVAFEVDGHEPHENLAWSVVVLGSAQLVESDDESVVLEGLPLFPWNTAPKYNFVEIIPTQVTGRRFVAEGRQ